jgi:hypothetical protein
MKGCERNKEEREREKEIKKKTKVNPVYLYCFIWRRGGRWGGRLQVDVVMANGAFASQD